MARRVRQLASSAAFVEFEEIPTAQYVHATPSGVPTIVSLYNVDSASHRDTARMTGRKPWRELYRAKRTEGTERRAVRRADAVLAVSDHDRRQFEHWGARQSILVPNGVDASSS